MQKKCVFPENTWHHHHHQLWHMYYILHSSSTSAAHDPALHLLLKQAWDLVMGSYSQPNIILLLFGDSH
jgi:hypothetical protein